MIHQSIAPNYTKQESTLTVLEALEEFYGRNPNSIWHTGDGLKDNFFRSHDTIHVVFGCDTVLHDEALADMWTIFGSDLGFCKYLSYLAPLREDLESIFDGMDKTALFKDGVKAIPDMVRVIFRARNMHGKWPWVDHEEYLDRPLWQVRRELNVQVVN